MQKGRTGRYDPSVLILHPSDFGQPDHYEGLLGRFWYAWTDMNYDLGDFPYPIRVIVYHDRQLHDVKLQYPGREIPAAVKKPKYPAAPDTRYISYDKAKHYFDRYLTDVEAEDMPEKNRLLLARLRMTRQRLVDQWNPTEAMRIERMNKYPHLRMGAVRP